MLLVSKHAYYLESMYGMIIILLFFMVFPLVGLGPCGSNPCGNGATCLDYGVNAAGQETYTCLCPRGMHGVNCDQMNFDGRK